MNISPFLNGLKQRLADYKTRNGFTYFDHFEVAATEGKKYFKVFRCEVFADGKQNHNSIVAFVDKLTGEIFKPATFSAPAKWARGNINSEFHGMEAIDESGFVKYLRGG